MIEKKIIICHNRVRPDLPNKEEEIHMQYTAVEGCFICITIPLGVFCTATESCIILAIDNFF